MSEVEKRNIKADPAYINIAEHHRQEWVLIAPEGCKKEDLNNPAFWSLVSANLRPYARVEVRAQDGTWICDCMVLCCDRNWAKIRVLHTYDLTSSDVAQTQASQYEVKFRGPRLWSIIRNSDGEIIKQDIATRDIAVAELAGYERLTT